ncbi:MAG: dTDP-4-dehydrorhamnose 3,5-epimerase [Flavobacteriaceae bacterium]|nr:dTDP-4-dehydrorhamnose 3,5-epimerase [Flavobacteriaceae bacterium]
MKITKTELEGCFVIEPQVFMDSRGYFFESYNAQKFNEATGLEVNFVQDNEALSEHGVVRGLHLQRAPFLQAKLLRVLMGKILDVAVDVRQDSPTYGRHFAIELSAENKLQLFVPRGMAHGYSVLSERALVAYKCDMQYSREHEDGIYLLDKELNIDWKIDEKKMILSEKDQRQKSFKEFEAIRL